MFRITRADRPSHILITIEGQLAGDYVGVAESACGEALATNNSVTVFLKNLMEIDAHGHAFLRQLVLKRARLRGSGVYLRHIIRNLQKSRDRNS